MRLGRVRRGLCRDRSFGAPEAPTRRSPRLENLREFEEAWSELDETLREAMRFGPDEALEKRYSRARASLLKSYPALKPLLGAYLAAEPPRHRFGSPPDDFERLFHPTALSGIVAGDERAIVESLERTRAALAMYARHLSALLGLP